MRIIVLLAGDLTKDKITPSYIGDDERRPAFGFRYITIGKWDENYITY
jgi:hypothetical protein